MACKFAGYFLKKGTTILDSTIIAPGGYKCTPCIRTDKNSYVDGDGNLHRSILPVKRSKLSITTVGMLTYEQKCALQAMFPSRDSTTLIYWNDETNDYEEATFYVPDVEFTIAQEKNSKLFYEPISVTLIAYGGDT